jgi:hypothetical protein
MKKLLVFVFLGFGILSCSNPDDFGLDSTQFIYTDQKWELVRMTGNIEGSETTGDEMEWQESYVFSPNGTFLKTRTTDTEFSEATGTFEVIEKDEDMEHYLNLTYETGKTILGSCNGDGAEVLRYLSLKRIANTWNMCDGPGLEYSLVQD